jgi:hypothetical protein
MLLFQQLQNIQNTYQSISAFFYKAIPQSVYVNNNLSKQSIDYSLLIPGSEFLYNLTDNQINAQIQFYVDLCNDLIVKITTNINTQTNLQLERLQVVLNTSISNLNVFALALISARNKNIIYYVVQYNMGMLKALYLNNISYDTYEQQVLLNQTVNDFNNIQKGTLLILSIGK